MPGTLIAAGGGGGGAFIAVRIFGVVAKEGGLEKRHNRPNDHLSNSNFILENGGGGGGGGGPSSATSALPSLPLPSPLSRSSFSIPRPISVAHRRARE